MANQNITPDHKRRAREEIKRRQAERETLVDRDRAWVDEAVERLRKQREDAGC